MINHFSEWPKGWTVEGDYKISSDLQYAEMGRWRRHDGHEADSRAGITYRIVRFGREH